MCLISLANTRRLQIREEMEDLYLFIYLFSSEHKGTEGQNNNIIYMCVYVCVFYISISIDIYIKK